MVHNEEINKSIFIPTNWSPLAFTLGDYVYMLSPTTSSLLRACARAFSFINFSIEIYHRFLENFFHWTTLRPIIL